MRLLLSFILFTFCASCGNIGNKRITGNGKLASEQRNHTGFSGVEVAGPYDVYLQQGAAYSVKIEGDENLLRYVETEVSGNELHIGTKESYNLKWKRGIKVYVTAPQFNNLAVAGSGNIRSDAKLSAPSTIDIQIGGSGDVVLEVDAPQIRTDIGGSGSATLTGRTRSFNAGVAGSGEIHGFNLLSEDTDVDIAGSGDAEVFASKTLNISIAGSGDVRYRGKPSVKQSIAGSGNVRAVE